jgi:hypothetical protein
MKYETYAIRDSVYDKVGATRRSNDNLRKVIKTARDYKVYYLKGKEGEFLLNTLKGSISFYGMMYKFAREDYSRATQQLKQNRELAQELKEHRYD